MEKRRDSLTWNQRISFCILANSELFFYRLGRSVALHPKKTILLTFVIVLSSLAGFLRFSQERNPFKLWVPRKSSFTENSEWLMETFERGFRLETAILEAPDVLNPEVIKELAWIDREVKRFTSQKGDKYEDLCLKLPKISPTNELIGKIKFSCVLLDFLDEICLEHNLLQLWDYNSKEIANITKEDILGRVNKYERHPIFSNLIIYEDLLGGVVKNQSGHIVSATHLHTMWLLKVNYTAIDTKHAGNNAGTADFASEESLTWELTFLERMKDMQRQLNHSTMYYMSARSFGDISNVTMFQDYHILVIGVIIVTLYMYFVISRYNWIEGRIYIVFFGFLTIGFAFIVGCSASFLVGMSTGPVHASLPFLLLGIGVDDLFVLITCLDGLTEEQKKLPVEERIAAMLKHAGASITVTTVTDVVAFLVGATTVIPGLQSYCVFAAFCLAFTYIFTCTFFVACLTFDTRRADDNRNCCFPCRKTNKDQKNDCSQRNYTQKCMQYLYSTIILTWPGKLLVLLIVAILTTVSIEGVRSLEQKFDPAWFLPSHSYASQYITLRRERYPYLGYEGSLYVGAVNYTHEFRNIKSLSDTLSSYRDVIYTFNSWVPEYQQFVLDVYKKDLNDEILSDSDFQLYLSEFLYRNGSKFQQNFKFATELECGKPAPKIEVSGIDFRFKLFSGPEQHVPAMRKLIRLTEGNNFTTGDKRAFVWSMIFSIWIPDEIVEGEVARNLILALVCVMLCTFVLIADLRTCLWILLCVLLTMLNVAGFMQFWGITIDITSCIALQLAIGLCVDYASHIGYTFLTITDPDRNKRSIKAVVVIGPAVLYGGLSTLIAVLLLAGSEAYAFQIFFKLFFMVTTMGLFNGLVFLPVVLSWLGSPPYKVHQPLQQHDVALY